MTIPHQKPFRIPGGRPTLGRPIRSTEHTSEPEPLPPIPVLHQEKTGKSLKELPLS